MRVDAAGTFTVVDTVNRRLSSFDANGRLTVQDLRDVAAWPVDVVGTGTTRWVLDRGADQILRFDNTGAQALPVSKHLAAKLTRLSAPAPDAVDGDVADFATTPLVAAGRAVAATGLADDAGFAHEMRAAARETPVAIDFTDGSFRRRAAIVRFQRGDEVRVSVSGLLTVARYLGTDTKGRRFVVAEEITGTGGRITVQRFVGRSLEAIAELPLSSLFVPKNAIVLAPDGRVYGLLVERNYVDVLELVFVAASAAVASMQARDALGPQLAMAAVPISGTGNVRAASRQNAVSIAGTYWLHQWYCTQNNWNQCTSNGKTSCRPSYLNAGYNRYYYEVPYKWGGWATVAEFDTDMAYYARTAGDVCTGAILSCASGVDCSGFVQRCWEKNNWKHADTHLVDFYTTSLAKNWSQLLQADVIDWYGVHIAMFDQFQCCGGGIYTYQAADANGGRVGYDYYSYAYLNGSSYKAHRWCVC